MNFESTGKNRKNKTDCFCALCRSPRVIRYSRHLQFRHYLQIIILSSAFTFSTYSWIAFNGFFALPIIWALFEGIHKSLYRKDLKCPYCGFDPTWYKKDIKLARRKVEEFVKQNPDSPFFPKSNPSSENSSPIKQ